MRISSRIFREKCCLIEISPSNSLQDTNVINTAILSGRQTGMSMKILAISDGGYLSDVTTKSHCISSETRVLKTSPTCSSVYVDGFFYFLKKYHDKNFILTFFKYIFYTLKEIVLL